MQIKFVLHVGLAALTSSTPNYGGNRDDEWQEHMEQELVLLREKSRKLVKTSLKLNPRRDKQIALGAKHAPSLFKRGATISLSCTCSSLCQRQEKKKRREKITKRERWTWQKRKRSPMNCFVNEKRNENVWCSHLASLPWKPRGEEMWYITLS